MSSLHVDVQYWACTDQMGLKTVFARSLFRLPQEHVPSGFMQTVNIQISPRTYVYNIIRRIQQYPLILQRTAKAQISLRIRTAVRKYLEDTIFVMA